MDGVMLGAARDVSAGPAREQVAVRVVLHRSEENGFGISIADNEDGDAVITEVTSRQAREAGVEPGAIILRVSGYDVERQGLAGVKQAVALSPSSLQTEFVLRLGEPLPPVVTEAEMQAAVVMQSRYRGHRSRQQLAQQQYEDARQRQLGSAGGLWGDVRYEPGADRHDAILERLETMEHEIARASTDLSLASSRREAKLRERVPLAAGRAGSSAYYDSRTARWSRPNTALASRHGGSSTADGVSGVEAKRQPGEFQPGLLMAAWDKSHAASARRLGLSPPPPLPRVAAAAAAAAAVAATSTTSATIAAPVSTSASAPGASGSPAAPLRRSISKRLAALESSEDAAGFLRMGRRSFV
jgi:hypothetical protein